MGYLKRPPKTSETMITPGNVTTVRLSGTESNERGSLRSSDDARSTGSPQLLEDGISPIHLDERTRLIRKIEKIKEKIARHSITHEGDIEEYLRITENPKLTQENPQLTRIKQHFEKKNRKYTQEMEFLQKKIDDAEQKLSELEKGNTPESGNRHRVLQNVGHGIKRTGVNIKDLTGNSLTAVMSAPRDIANKMKKNMFGSADNIPGTVENADTVDVGQSKFYTTTPKTRPNLDRSRAMTSTTTTSGDGNNESDIDKTDQANQSRNEQHASMHGHGRTSSVELEHIGKLMEESEGIKRRCTSLEDKNKELNAEIGMLRSELTAARFQTQKLEQTLNETMEVHQNEMKQLKHDLNLIGSRMDYQYNDRFKKIEEKVESTQNVIYRIETNLHENSERLLSATHNIWNALMLNGANIIVEILKIVLYFIAVILDTIKPIAGTRGRAGILLTVTILFFILWSSLDISSMIGNLVKKESSISTSASAINA